VKRRVIIIVCLMFSMPQYVMPMELNKEPYGNPGDLGACKIQDLSSPSERAQRCVVNAGPSMGGSEPRSMFTFTMVECNYFQEIMCQFLRELPPEIAEEACRALPKIDDKAQFFSIVCRYYSRLNLAPEATPGSPSSTEARATISSFLAIINEYNPELLRRALAAIRQHIDRATILLGLLERFS
jgi:hypothetical protein